jgi:hypothetical protein
MDKLAKPSKRAAELAAQINPDDITIKVNPELPQPVSMDKVLQGEIAKTETICEKARRLAEAEELAEFNRQYDAKAAFLSQFGLRVQLFDPVYELCGRKWVLVSAGRAYLLPDTSETYRGIPLYESEHMVSDLVSLGRVVMDMEYREKELHILYPRTIWGTLMLMVNYPLTGHIWG